MSETAENIAHPGQITQLTEAGVEIMFLSKSGCTSCDVKGACTMAEMEQKHVWVDRLPGMDYHLGQQVNVFMRRQQGTLAVFLGYILPFLFLFSTLIGMIGLGFNEGVAGLSALLILIPYYLALFAFKDRIGKKFKFYIQ